MPQPIQSDAIFILSMLHALYLLLIGGAVWWLLPTDAPRRLRFLLGGVLVVAFGWSLAAMISFWQSDTGFFSWFLDPAAEKNFTALTTSLLLATVSLTALALLWHGRQTSTNLQRVYWLVIAVMFSFLAADEYASLHEGFIYWRQGYLGLGGTVALLSLAVIATSNAMLRRYVTIFLLGLGSLGFAGVVLDAFSTYSVIDIGPIELTFLQCSEAFLGVRCLDYSNTEEMVELVGAATMALGLLAALGYQLSATSQQQQTRTTRLLTVGVGAWALVIIGWLWLAPAVEHLTATDARVDYGDLRLLSYRTSQDRIAIGDTLDVTLYMSSTRFLRTDYSLSLHLYTYPTQETPNATSVAQDDMLLGEFEYPTRGWLPYVPVRNRFDILIDDTVTLPASYQLVAILWQETPQNKIIIQQTPLTTLADNTVAVLDGVPAPPAADNIPEQPITPDYTFAEGFTLTGYQLPQTIRAGDSTTVRFWWQTEAAITTELTHFLHWFHEESGEYIIYDQTPRQGTFPTDDWAADMRLYDAWTVTLPDDAPAGTYRLQTGMYDVQTQERMPVNDVNGDPVLDASIVLGTVTITDE